MQGIFLVQLAVASFGPRHVNWKQYRLSKPITT